MAIDDVSNAIRHSRIIKSATVSNAVEIYDPIRLTTSFVFSEKIYNSWSGLRQGVRAHAAAQMLNFLFALYIYNFMKFTYVIARQHDTFSW